MDNYPSLKTKLKQIFQKKIIKNGAAVLWSSFRIKRHGGAGIPRGVQIHTMEETPLPPTYPLHPWPPSK